MIVENIMVIGYYDPGKAASNFILSFAKGYARVGKKVDLVLVSKNDYKDDEPNLNITVFKESSSKLILFRKLKIQYDICKFIKSRFIENKTVVQVYGCPLWSYFFNTKKFNVFYTIGELPFVQKNRGVKYKFIEFIKLISTKFAMGLLVQTENLRQYYLDYGIKNVGVYDILIDSKRFLGLKEKVNVEYLTYCGLVSVYKDGVLDLLKAFKIFHSQYVEYKLKIIGSFYSREDELQIKKFVKKNNLENAVVFTGLIPPSEIPIHLFNSSLLLLSRPNNVQAKYGFPSKIGEYLMTGVPVIVTDVGEIKTFLNDRETCLFALPDNPKDFAEKMLWAIDHYEEALLVGQRGKKYAMNHFSIESQCVRMIRFMESIIVAE